MLEWFAFLVKLHKKVGTKATVDFLKKGITDNGFKMNNTLLLKLNNDDEKISIFFNNMKLKMFYNSKYFVLYCIGFVCGISLLLTMIFFLKNRSNQRYVLIK